MWIKGFSRRITWPYSQLVLYLKTFVLHWRPHHNKVLMRPKCIKDSFMVS